MFESNFTTWVYILAGAAVKSTVVLAAAFEHADPSLLEEVLGHLAAPGQV